MFERQKNYPRAITVSGSSAPAQAQATAIKWTLEQQEALGGTILVYVPTKSTLADADNLISQFAGFRGVVVATWKGNVSWPGGPVIAAWPSREKLAEIGDHPGTRALVVIPWGPNDTDAWERAFQPALLAGAQGHARKSALDPVTVQGLKALTRMVNHANNLAGSLDHRDAVAVLRALHKGGYGLPANEVYSWALANGWPARGAERLREMASKIDAGRIVQMKGGSPLKVDILDSWKLEAAASAD
jgi:hypothetical protein